MMNAWAEERETISDGERAIANMSGYLFRNQHRFLDIDDDSIQGNLAGYTKDGMFLLTDQAFLQGVGDLNANIAKKALLEAGYLHVQGKSKKDPRYKSHYKLPGTNIRRPFYCIKMDILNVDGTS